MKKIITTPILFIVACLLITSCAQDFSGNAISKRHYRSGYYIAKNNNKPVESKTVESKKLIPDATTLAVEEIKETTNDNVVEKERTLNVEELPLAANVTNDDSKQGKASTLTTTNKVKAIKTLLKNSSKIKETVSSIKEAKKSHRGGGGGGNLLWTILLILLVLILIGAVLDGSLGGALIGLITLILVIVLVIWLLRLLGIL